MAREGTKRQKAIEIMNANSKKSMEDVIQLISEANDLTRSAARGYYVYLSKMGMAKARKPNARTSSSNRQRKQKSMTKKVGRRTKKA